MYARTLQHPRPPAPTRIPPPTHTHVHSSHLQDRAAEARRAETNQWEAKRREEGPRRLEQGKKAIAWGGTAAAEAKAAYEAARAAKTVAAHEASATKVLQVKAQRHEWMYGKVAPADLGLTARELQQRATTSGVHTTPFPKQTVGCRTASTHA